VDRRRFLLTSLAGALTAPLAVAAQQPGKVYRIGVLSSGTPEQEIALLATMQDALRERGWIDGQNLFIERRYAHGKYERAPDLISDLLHLNPDLLMTRGGPVTTAAKRATATVPIVMWGITDPVGIGVVASLARPGGNVTGLSDDQGPDIVGKRLQLLKEVAPGVTRLGILSRVPPSAAVPRVVSYENAFKAAAKELGVQVRWWYLRDAADIDRAFPEIVREGITALDIPYQPVTWAHRRQIFDLAARHRLPAIYWHRGYAFDGGLMAYGEDEREVPRRLAGYVDRILKGTKPGDLPVEQPTKFELVINLKTAKALGLTIPPSLLLRADQVIE
jgi:putative ABC transport system substrate-binding protein